MVDKTGWDLFPAAYLMLACVVGLCALPFLIETAGASIAGTDIPCADSDEAGPAQPDDAIVRA
jgi:MFS transporter, MHS family, proline/betaine transporter